MAAASLKQSFRRRADRHHPDRVLRDRHDRRGRGDDPDHPALLSLSWACPTSTCCGHASGDLQAGHPLQRLGRGPARLFIHPFGLYGQDLKGVSTSIITGCACGPWARPRRWATSSLGAQPGRRRQVHHALAQSALDPVGVRLGRCISTPALLRPRSMRAGRRAERRAAHRRQDRRRSACAARTASSSP